MTQKILWVLAVSVALVLSGCESQEQPTTTTAPQQVVKTEKATKAEDVEKKAPAVETVQAVAEEAKEAVEKTVEKTTEEATEKAEEVQASAQEAVTKVEKQVETTVAAVTTAVTKPVAAAKESAAPAEVVIEASYGNVTLPHAMHAEAYACTNCHGDATPGAMTLGKDAAHELCKGCHKDEGAGPTGCKGCHVK